MEKIKSKQKSRPSAVDTPALPVCPEQETLSNMLEILKFSSYGGRFGQYIDIQTLVLRESDVIK